MLRRHSLGLLLTGGKTYVGEKHFFFSAMNKIRKKQYDNQPEYILYQCLLLGTA